MIEPGALIRIKTHLHFHREDALSIRFLSGTVLMYLGYISIPEDFVVFGLKYKHYFLLPDGMKGFKSSQNLIGEELSMFCAI